MGVSLHHIVIDAHDLPVLARFWAQVLDWRVPSRGRRKWHGAQETAPVGNLFIGKKKRTSKTPSPSLSPPNPRNGSPGPAAPPPPRAQGPQQTTGPRSLTSPPKRKKNSASAPENDPHPVEEGRIQP